MEGRLRVPARAAAAAGVVPYTRPSSMPQPSARSRSVPRHSTVSTSPAPETAARTSAAAHDPTRATAPPSRIDRISGWNWPLLLLVGLCALTLFGALTYPTYPNYDSVYTLLWGRELLDGQLPSFDAYRAPTQHPLWVVLGMLLAPLGEGADRVLVWLTIASFVLLVYALYRLGRTSFTMLVGIVAAAILCTRFDFPFLAARGYLDIPFLALVVWAGVLEAERSRRGTPVFLLLLCAGLLRPEAWLLSGLYWLWLFPGATWRERVKSALLVGAAPIIWMATDLIVTGDPLFSQNHTSGLAEELGRNRGIGDVPSATVNFLKSLVKLPVAVAGLVGFALAAWLTPTRLRVPLALFVGGVLTFVAVGVAGLSVINRYLLVPSLMVMVFAAVALTGWTMLREGRARRVWALLALGAVLFGVVWTALRVDLTRLDNELNFRGNSHNSLVDLLDDPKVRAAAKCGPVLTPNHRLIPDVRWILDLPEDRVIARSDSASAEGVNTGLAILAGSRQVFLRQGLDAGRRQRRRRAAQPAAGGLRADRCDAVLLGVRALR